MAGVKDAQNDHRLWYDRPAVQWKEALPIGNGKTGGMIFGGPRLDRIQLNEDTLWGGAPNSSITPANARAHLDELRRLIETGRTAEADDLAKKCFMACPPRQASYQTLGDLYIEMTDLDGFSYSDYVRDLKLDTSEASVRFQASGVAYERKYIACPESHIMAVTLSASQPGRISCNLFFESPQAQSAVTVGEDGRTLVLQGRNGIELDCASSLEFQARLATAVEGGHVKNAGDHLQIRGADSVALKMAVATSYVRFDDVTGDPDATTKANVSRVSAETYEHIASRAICRYRSVYDRVSIDLGSSRESHRPTDQRLLDYHNGAVDPSLSALYFQYGRYLLISSSWPGTQPANLQGIWNDSIRPPWGSKYTVNINTEMNYWPAESANLPEMVGPMFEMVRDLSITGRATAREMYGARGWVCHHNTDLWRATAPIDAPSYGLWPLGGAWLCMTLWDHYDYGRNPNYLASMYPILKGSCEFFIDTLTVSGLTGQLVMNPTMSPENVHGTGGASALCAGTTMDAQILRELFRVTAYSSLALGVEPDFRSQLTLFASKLRPTDVGKDGQIKEWDQDWDGQVPDLQHRHVSHLWGLYPGHQITIEKNSDLIDAARISLNIRGDEGPGWSTAWKMNLWARMRDSARAYSLHKRLLSPELCYPNMFDAHPPLDQNSTSCFQIDGNLGGVSGIIEMLVYSAGEDIVLLPALPIQWQTGSVRGIRLRGAWTIDIEWANGSPVVVCVYAHLDGTRSLRYGTHSISVKLLKGETRSISSF